MSENLAFRRNISWQFVGSMTQMGFSALTLVVMARGLDATGYGRFAVIMGLVYVANALFEPRMQDVAAKQFWDISEHNEGAMRHNQAVGDLFLIECLGKLLPLAGLCVLSPFLARFSNLPEDGAELIILAALGVYLSKLGAGVATGLMRVSGRSDLYAYCLVGEVFIRLVLLTGLTLAQQLRVVDVIIVQAVTGIGSIFVQWVLVSQHILPILPVIRSSGTKELAVRIQSYRRLLASNLGISVTDLMNKDLDITIISSMIPATQVGVYKMAKSIVVMTWRTIDPFTLALMPELNRLVARSELHEVRVLIGKSAIGLFLLAVIIAGGTSGLIAICGAEIFGKAFVSLPSLLPFMFVGIVISSALVWGHPLSVALGRSEYALIGSVLAAVAGVLAFIALVPTYGVLGAGLSWTAAFVINFAIIAVLTLRRLGQQMRPGATSD